jgi:hypothetical protein
MDAKFEDSNYLNAVHELTKDLLSLNQAGLEMRRLTTTPFWVSNLL